MMLWAETRKFCNRWPNCSINKLNWASSVQINIWQSKTYIGYTGNPQHWRNIDNK
jgi:tRNA(Ser,Leu) C12 N-acetylase TAN1